MMINQSMNNKLLEIRDLTIDFNTDEGTGAGGEQRQPDRASG